MELQFLNAVAGFGVGVIVGLTGVGGGALMTPIMMLVFGVAPATAVGTDLWFAAITKVFGAIIHKSRGTIDWQILRLLFMGSIPASLLTLYWLHSTGASQTKGGLIIQALGATLILTSAAALFRERFHALGAQLRQSKPIPFKAMQPPLTVLAGVILGFLVTFTSIGAGALGAVMLLYLYPRRLTPLALVGTDIVHAIPLTVVAGIGHLMMGNVNGGLLASLLAGSIPGIVSGSLLASRVPAKFLRLGITFLLAIIGFKMLLT